MPVIFNSDDDDTDHLLQIPPDSFVISSDESITHSSKTINEYHPAEDRDQLQVVYNLLAQVNTIENRLSQIENKPMSSHGSKRNLSPQKYRRRMSSFNVGAANAQSTPKKSLQRSRLFSPPSSDSGDSAKGITLTTRYDPSGNSFDSLNTTASPPKRIADKASRMQTQHEEDSTNNDTDASFTFQNPTTEIETFLKSVECIKSHLKDTGDLRSAPQLKAIACFNRKVEKGYNQVTNSTMDSTISLLKSTNISKVHESNPSTMDWLHSMTSEKSKSPRDVSLRSPNTITNFQPGVKQPLEVLVKPNEIQSSSSESFPRNTLKEALFVLSNLKSNQERLETPVQNMNDGDKLYEKNPSQNHKHSPPEATIQTEPSPTPADIFKETGPTLLSLNSLWGHPDSTTVMTAATQTTLSQKYEEERYRRQHCEKLIEALQVRILEYQEKISVAVNVDAAKDEAIEKLKETFSVVQKRCNHFQTECDKAFEELRDCRRKLETVNEDTENKIQHYEQELTKALELAHKAQSAYDKLEKDLSEINFKYQETLEENKKLSSQIELLQADIENDKLIMTEIRKMANESKLQITASVTQTEKLEQEKYRLQEQVDKQEITISKLEAEKKNLESLLELSKSNEKKILLEKDGLLANQEQSKSELRAFYQKQVEAVVQEKLKEFQSQLDSVEKNLQQQNEKFKLEVARNAAQYMKETVDKHKFEVRLLEERHAEEIKLHKIQKQQSDISIRNLQFKLQKYQSSREKLASRLHQLIESQWREAIRIININGSPGGSEISLVKQDSVANLQKLLDEEEFMDNGDDKRHKRVVPADELPTSDRDGDTYRLPQQPNTASTSRVSSSQSDRYKGSDHPTPLSIRQPPKKDESDLQKYIKMLLGSQIPSDDSELECGFIIETKTRRRNSDFSCKKSGKPPWK